MTKQTDELKALQLWLMKTLFAVDERIGRVRWRKAGPVKRELSRDELLKRLAEAGRAWKMISITLCHVAALH